MPDLLAESATAVIVGAGVAGLTAATMLRSCGAEMFARAARDFAQRGDETGLRDYSAVCLRHTWTYQEFSRWMLEMMHDPGQQADPFRARLARARLDRLLHSESAAREFGELISGLA